MNATQIIGIIIIALACAAIVGFLCAAVILAVRNSRIPVLTAAATLIDRNIVTVWKWQFRIYKEVCRLTFRLESGETLSFDSESEKYEWLAAGDAGMLSYHGSTLLGFEKHDPDRKKKNQWTYTEE